MKAYLSKISTGYLVHVLTERYSIIVRKQFSTAQEAFDFLAENHPSITTDVEIHQ